MNADVKGPEQVTQNSVSARVALKRQINVMHAVILRDIRSRFFSHGLGFLIAPLFPVAHIVILLTIYTATSRTAIFGDDLKLFFATGLVPVLTITYISRFMSSSLLANKSMLAFPAVRLIDIVLARSILEFLAIVISTFLIVIILMGFGTSPAPYFPYEAFICMVFTAVLAVGIGIVVSVITAIFPIASMVYAFSTVIIYLASGAPIYLEALPAKIVYICSFNPAFQAVAWMRSAYYMGYPTQYLDKTYLLMWAICSLAVGLLMERSLRQYILSGR